ncbi:hypothetical protein SAMN05216359_10321 [Roseateles sp. YR242]|uniref:hypothetical protein n=1 Tax=Roseateles sp. YR242 TaxID=1855305 RepID=UPI0008D3AE49|nr:hypothetical protein [Roseateles sp. YR242]SEK77100.1 hypothetical protein SAMN05216359_10321 [Roseateles sp. YR242]
MSDRDWARCHRDARRDEHCTPWLRQALGTCVEAARHGRALPDRWAEDRRGGHYLLRLPALMGHPLADRYCMRVKPRVYGLRSHAIGDRRVFLVGADPGGQELMLVRQVLQAAFQVHGANGAPWRGDPLRDALLVPAPDTALL